MDKTVEALHVLALLLPGKVVPSDARTTEDRRRVIELQTTQHAAGWRHLRARYPNTLLAARELTLATVRATNWVHELLPPGTRVENCIRLALITSLARRLIVDGEGVAEATFRNTRRSMMAAAHNAAS